MRRSLRWFGFVAAVACLLAGSPAAATPTGTVTAPVTQQTASYPPDRYVRYITYVYGDLLGRAPDAAGLRGWVAALSSGTPRGQVATAISHSREYREGLVRGAYDRYLNRAPDPGGLKHWADALDRGWTISVIESGFLASQEYYQRSGSTRAGWVRQLYRVVLDRGAAQSEVDHWARVLAAGYTRAQVALGFLLSTERLTTVVDGYYVQLLGRHIDPAGRRTWVGALQAGRHDEEIIAGIVGSEEYWGLTAVYPLSELVLSPEDPVVEVGEPLAFTVRGLGSGDDLGDLTGEAVVSLDGKPCPDATCMTTVPGEYVVTAEIGDMWTLTGLTVVPGPVDSLDLSPVDATIADGASVVYAAHGFDAYGNDLGDVTDQLVLAVDGDPGACDGARCRPVGTGQHTVTVDGFEGAATLTMSPPGPLGYEIWGWGRSDAPDDVLPAGLWPDYRVPRALGFGDRWADVDGGGSFAMAVGTDGSLWAWGAAPDYLCPGFGAIDRPEQVGSETDWVEVTVGMATAVARKADGTLWAWGDLSFGARYDHQRVCTPTQIAPERHWRSVEATSAWAAIAEDGSLWMWGRNQGQLGDGTTESRVEPVLIDAGPWSVVSPGELHTVGVKEDGTLWAWGRNATGALGDGTYTSSLVPVRIGERADWTGAAAAGVASVAVAADGTLWSWGSRLFSSYPSPSDLLVPTLFDGSQAWARVYGNGDSRITMAADGTLWAWGDNTWHVLGVGDVHSYVTQPTQVGVGGGWFDVSTRHLTTLALRDPGAAP